MITMSSYNTDGLVSLHEEYNRIAKAIDELEWEGDFERSDSLRHQLKHVEALRQKGDVYVPLF